MEMRGKQLHRVSRVLSKGKYDTVAKRKPVWKNTPKR